MKKLLSTALALLTLCSALAQPGSENQKAREEFSQERFGIFIHWGIYSMLGQGEWVMNNKGIPYDEYCRLAAGFNPSRYNADEWVKAFKEAGAKYVTITSRHHDGFSMFKTAQSPYNIVDATPFGRDVIGELAQACHKEGIKLHFYYSHLDWGRPDYWPLGRTGHAAGRPMGRKGDWEHYVKFMNAQLTELLTQYGPIGAIWFDGVWDKNAFPREAQPAIWHLAEQYALIHKLQPGCLVGNNHHLVPFEGEDIQIFERDIPGKHGDGGYSREQGISDSLPLETCQTMNHSWGYNITDTDYKSADYLIRYLVQTAGKGANLLLNIGPRPDGTLPDEALERLKAMGQWLSAYGDAIYGTTAGCVPEQSWGVTTQKGNTLYVHVLNPSKTIYIPLEGCSVKAATDFSGSEKLTFEKCKSGIILTLPENPEGPDYIATITLK